MSRLRMVLLVKAAIALFALALPLLFLPLEGFQLLGFPEYDFPAAFFIRMLGAVMVAMAVVDLWTSFAPQANRGGLVAVLVECLATLAVIWHFVFYGGIATWPVRGKIIVVLLGVVQFAFLLALLVTGWEALLPRRSAEGAEKEA
jgi:hypothetical protein